MKLNGVIPVIEVADIERQLAFYQQAFRFVVIHKRTGPAGLEWVHLKSDNTWLMLLQRTQPAGHHPPAATGKNNISLYYYTDDVISCHRYMKAKGFAVGELSAREYGMLEYSLHDPEGNSLAVGQINQD